MRAAAIFFLARVIRAAIVGSAIRNALATSAVLSPHSSRRVSATCASGASDGWQQVKISRSRSSGNGPPAAAAGSSSTSSGSARRSVTSRRSRSRARRRATVVSQAPGLRRYAAIGPGREGLGVRVLDALLGEIDVAGDPHRRGEHERPLATVRLGHRRGHAGTVHRRAQSKTLTGRTSTPPNGAGTCLASAIASSRSAASTT